MSSSRQASPHGEGACEALDAPWIAQYVAVLVTAFIPLYLFTRSSILIGDGQVFIDLAREGDPSLLHYGESGHFLQVPLARMLWLAVDRIGLPVPLEGIFLGLSLSGTVGATVFVGLTAAQLLRSRVAAWLAAILFGTSLHSWTQWNGELYGMALAFSTAGLYLTLRGHIALPAFLWGCSVLSHSEFALTAPAFGFAVWMAHSTPPIDRVFKMSLLLALAVATTLILLLAGSRAVGKWNDWPSLSQWLQRSYETRQKDVDGPEVARAMKGILTAHTVAGHYWRDILTGRGAWNNPWFIPASLVGLLVLAATAVFVTGAAGERRLLLVALAWLVPVHVLFNWWFVSTVEKYHGAALPGLILLIAGGLVLVCTHQSRRHRRLLFGAYLLSCAGLNLTGAVLPMKALGDQTDRAEQAIRRLNSARGGTAVFVSCDNPRALDRARVSYLRIRSIWKGTRPEIEDAIASWANARHRDGYDLFLLDRWCLPEEWAGAGSKEPFDLFFLEQQFDIVPTSITAVPIAESTVTNPFSWRRGTVFELEPRSASN